MPHAHDYPFDRRCGAHTCIHCDDHRGLARCYCSWSQSGRDGRQELIEMGETIDPED
jgi:hypothetical protein